MQVRRVSKSEMAHLTLMHRGLKVQRAASERYHDSRSGGSLFRDKGDTVDWYIDFRTLRASLTSDNMENRVTHRLGGTGALAVLLASR